jgi:hypothetical protein
MKLLLLLGTELDVENALLYADWLPLNSRGLRWGELYRARMSNPRENMSADTVTFPSMTKSGDA